MDLLALARIHAHLCGDGCLCRYKSSEKDHKNRAEISYFNNNEKLINEFRTDMHTIFGVKTTYNKKQNKAIVKSLRIGNSLLELSEYHSRIWSIPNIFFNGEKQTKLEWIKAFVNDEGYIPNDRKWIRIKCVNYNGLKQIKEMVDSLQIKNSLCGPNCDQTWYLNIKQEKDFENFSKIPARKKNSGDRI